MKTNARALAITIFSKKFEHSSINLFDQNGLYSCTCALSIRVKQQLIFLLKFCLLLVSSSIMAQPTGSAKLYLEIMDEGEVLDFKSTFKKDRFQQASPLKIKNYQLYNRSDSKARFGSIERDSFIYLTLWSNDHQIEIVKNKKDTMRIEIINATRVYFMSIPFQKGHYKLYVNDGKDGNWQINSLPQKQLSSNQSVPNLTPAEWSAFRVLDFKQPSDYFISIQFKKQGLLNSIPTESQRREQYLLTKRSIQNFHFALDKAPMVACPECKGCFCQLFTVKAPSGLVLFNQIFHFQENNVNAVGIDSFEVIENKVSGVPDFCFYKNQEQQCYQYNRVINKYQQQVIAQFNQEPILIADSIEAKRNQNMVKMYLKSPFRFVFEMNCPGVQLPLITGYYANKIKVYHLYSDQLIHEMVTVGNRLKETPGCSDSLQIADYNFDGFPDFRICLNSASGRHLYYLYNQQRDTFIIEQTLSKMQDLSFDFDRKIVKGYINKQLNGQASIQKELLQLEGTALCHFTSTTYNQVNSIAKTATGDYIKQKRIYHGDTIGMKLLQKKPLVKNQGNFKFEVQFNPEEYDAGGDRGDYVKLLTISNHQKKWGPFIIHGNYLKEVGHWLDSLEIADFNFDGFPDIRNYNSITNDGIYNYFIYNPTEGIESFYQETMYSLAKDLEFIPKRKIIKGSFQDAQQSTYFFLKHDTLTLTTQEKDLSKPPFIEQSIYRYGNRFGLKSAYGSLDPTLKKEYGDYNFDGAEDFRIQSKSRPFLWDVYLYHPKQDAFKKDTLLSKFVNFDYNPLNRSLIGYYTEREDGGTSRITFYYRWSFEAMQMVLYQIQSCYANTAYSESKRCVVSKLVNGKWIEVEVFGAE